MAQLQSQLLKQLLLQARFAPEKQRVKQIEGCEHLVRLIKEGQSYPYEFVCFQLTGFRRPLLGEESYPKTHSIDNKLSTENHLATTRSHGIATDSTSDTLSIECDNLLDYEVLLHDLPVYVGLLSRSTDILVSDIAQKVYTVESLAKHLSVCGKTIRRWQKRGLIGRHMRFADGRVRLGFLSSTVKHFVGCNRIGVREGGDFSRVSKYQEDKILRRLAQWAWHCPRLRQEALRRTAKRFGRATETVRTILEKNEDNLAAFWPIGQGVAVKEVRFAKRANPADDAERIEMTELFEQGLGIQELMDRFGRSKSSVYRGVTLERARQLSEIAISYVPAPDFERPNAKKNILGAGGKGKDTANGIGLQVKIRQEVKRIGVEDLKGKLSTLDAYLRDVGQVEVLTAEQETRLFCKYNYLKYLAAQMQNEIDLDYPQARVLNQMRRYLAGAESIKHFLIKSNLRLVVSVARKHTRNEGEIMDLVGEGNATLLKAVEKFDFTRGFKFSTYATWAIVKRFATLRSLAARNVAGVGGDDDLLEDVSTDRRVGYIAKPHLDTARKTLEAAIENGLEKREAAVVRQYYGWEAANAKARKGKSFRQIGELLGLSKERIRQIEKAALAKLRTMLSGGDYNLEWAANNGA
ncbi:MAG: sigma-70 family RNA polymerase sigma factor [Sedimentisphaerales bacterium]|nr:sigma-70 family RNA polymerase sigma factor [Sedimentisphaerales bacterium]